MNAARLVRVRSALPLLAWRLVVLIVVLLGASCSVASVLVGACALNAPSRTMMTNEAATTRRPNMRCSA